MKGIATIAFIALFGIGFAHPAAAITPTCGCNASCEEGFLPSAVTKCTDEKGTCKSEKKENTCTLTCTKGKETKEVKATCAKVYSSKTIGFSPRQSR